MHTIHVRRSISASLTLALLLLCGLTTQAQSPGGRAVGGTPEQRTARHFATLRQSPPQLFAFLLRMPKGGDLHNHLSGAIYAESYVQWAADKALCVNQTTLVLAQPPCSKDAGQVAANTALTNSVLYRQLIDAWSMRFWQYSGQSGHDHFFDTFGKFGAATAGQTGAMVAEAAARAARGHVSYLELMLTPDGVMSSGIGQKVGFDGNFENTLSKLQTGGIADAVAAGAKALQDAEVEKSRLLKCGTAQADAGCAVTIRYVAQVTRVLAPGPVFAQMLTGFMLANDPNSKVVAVNLVAPEDALPAMQNFTLHMQMLNFLRPRFPRAHLTLHAGELAPGLVPPDGLSFHIRESVNIAHAERIGHGVDIMHETDAEELLRELAERNILVEICLTSNDVILGVSKAEHPLATYMQHDVPVALATDDEGVSRSEISREYLRAVEDQGLDYLQLKTLARNSLQYAFLPGASLWRDARKFVPVAECAQDTPGVKSISAGCQQFLAGSERARLQRTLEEEFRAFESKY
ncbi:MAG: adenosine deaminase [Pyrinomonadaceae bacterium]